MRDPKDCSGSRITRTRGEASGSTYLSEADVRMAGAVRQIAYSNHSDIVPFAPFFRGGHMLTTNWPTEIVKAAKSGDLAFFIGNGLTRLSGGPGWGELFEADDIQRLFTDREIDISRIGLLELCDFLESEENTTWERVKEKLFRKFCDLSPSLPHRIISELFGTNLKRVHGRKKKIFTSNFDRLLEGGALNASDIVYLHGDPEETGKWILTSKEYHSAENQVKMNEIVRSIHANAIIFIGYGHSVEDFDIAKLVTSLRKEFAGHIFSLVSPVEYHDKLFRSRLLRQGITPIECRMTKDVNKIDRIVGISKSLLDLVDQAGIDPDGSGSCALRAEVELTNKQLQAQRAQATIVLGLCALNRHVQFDGPLPTGGRRFSEKAEYVEEAGGPGFIVSKTLQKNGLDSYIVSLIGKNHAGKFVKSALNIPSTGRIFMDFLEERALDSSGDPLHTWESTILEPGISSAHRVFVDRRISNASMSLSQANVENLVSQLRLDQPRVMYFDKFFKHDIQSILQRAGQPPISQNTWTVYETGSEGDRYSDTRPGDAFDPEAAYSFEKTLSATGARCINVIAASFRFARDFLAKNKLNLKSYNSLTHRHDSPEIIGGRKIAADEDDVINSLLADTRRLDTFVSAIRDRAHEILRPHPLRVIIVTLHCRGCLVISAPVGRKNAWHFHEDGIPTDGKALYTASAGDVFRGTLVSCLAYAQKTESMKADVLNEKTWRSIAKLCNQAAGHKVMVPTVQECIVDTAASFNEWCKTI